MTIRRLTPDIGYLHRDALDPLGISQLVIAGGTVHWSGIVAAQSSPAGIELVSADLVGQLGFILDKLDAGLVEAGSDRTRIVSLTMFTTAIDELSAVLDTVYAPWVGAHRPALTVIGVARLSLPGALLEVQGSAMVAG